MIKTFQSIVDSIFTTAEQKKLILKTAEKHADAQSIFNRSLNEVTHIYKIDNVYSCEEKISENGEITEYSFSLYSEKDLDSLKKSFRNNEGTLILVDEEIKKKINKNFRYIKESPFTFKDKNISQCPDFIYEFNDNSFWINLKEIRNIEKEEIHTNNLECLYKSLFVTKEIEIDTKFLQYSEGFSEKLYYLRHFRLDRNSLHLVLEDKDTSQLITHTFNKIELIDYQNNQTNLKFWLHMDEGTYRFFIPINKDKLNNVPIDPIIYNIF